MTGFYETTLGQVLTFQRGFDITKKEQTPGEVSIISSSGPSSRHNKYKVKGPGVIIGRKGTLGTVHFSENNFWPHDTTLWIKDFKGNNPKFIYYFLKTLRLENFDTGSSNPTLNRNHIHKIKIFFPEEKMIQDKIAAILSAYDDLIENNKRRIALLEKMAEEIYREWFVRFRFPGYQTAEFEKGIPKSWEIVKLGNMVKIEKGLSYKGKYLDGNGAFLVNLKCFTTSGGYRLEGEKYYSGPFTEKHKVSEGDIIIANTDLTQDGGIIGNPEIIPEGFHNNDLIISHHLCAVRLGERLKQKNFIFHTLKTNAFKGHAKGFANGATVLGLRKEEIERYQFLLPPENWKSVV